MANDAPKVDLWLHHPKSTKSLGRQVSGGRPSSMHWDDHPKHRHASIETWKTHLARMAMFCCHHNEVKTTASFKKAEAAETPTLLQQKEIQVPEEPKPIVQQEEKQPPKTQEVAAETPPPVEQKVAAETPPPVQQKESPAPEVKQDKPTALIVQQQESQPPQTEEVQPGSQPPSPTTMEQKASVATWMMTKPPSPKSA